MLSGGSQPVPPYRDDDIRCMMFDANGRIVVRTTLAIDDDVLLAARAIAQQPNQTVGQVVSELARNSLHPPTASSERNGVPLLPVRRPKTIVTLDIVNALRDQLP